MMGGFGMGFGAIIWIALLAVVIWAVTSTARTERLPEDSAKAILDQRLARGEISLDEYRKLREAL